MPLRARLACKHLRLKPSTLQAVQPGDDATPGLPHPRPNHFSRLCASTALGRPLPRQGDSPAMAEARNTVPAAGENTAVTSAACSPSNDADPETRRKVGCIGATPPLTRCRRPAMSRLSRRGLAQAALEDLRCGLAAVGSQFRDECRRSREDPTRFRNPRKTRFHCTRNVRSPNATRPRLLRPDNHSQGTLSSSRARALSMARQA
ncbi:hypothetical protein V8D89_002522 [Ganoderma adspersum]